MFYASSTYEMTKEQRRAKKKKHEPVGPNDERCRLGRFVCFFKIWFVFFPLTDVFIGSMHLLPTKRHKGTKMGRKNTSWWAQTTKGII
jgi:hypothetical protein